MAASFEAMLDLWSAALREGKARMRPLFKHPSVAESASAYIDGLLGPERRKTGWMRAEAAGDTGPWRQQAVLGRAAWDADALRDVVRDYVIEMLGAPDAVLVIDETGFLKQGKSSCGVSRQYTGSAGKITNSDVRRQRFGARRPHPAEAAGCWSGWLLRRAGGGAAGTTVDRL
jgi:SRSO17 transposase